MNEAKHSFGITMGEKVFYTRSASFDPEMIDPRSGVSWIIETQD